MKTFQAVLFDLDGTLLDTAHDLIAALSLLTDSQFTVTHELRAASGKGFRGLLKAALHIGHEDARYADFFERFQLHYENCLLDRTHFFTGMQELLQQLDEKNIPWGIVTNKPDKFTQRILQGLQLTERAKCIISGDSLTNRKPHPEPLLHACKLLKKSPGECLYLGDSESDVIASKAAGVTSLVALYGYISATENPHAWQADGYIAEPLEVLRWF